MIITQTPFRMSFFGGGTDFPDFYKEHGGAVISTTFDKYCYVNVRHLPRFFDYSTELSYSKIERVTDVNDINHPAIREAMKYLDMQEIRLTYEADLPARSGLGTSSSFAVGMLNAFYALKGKYADKRKLADDAIYLERVLCNESGGVQDQIAAAFGGLNRINFNADGYEVNPVIISPERKQQLKDEAVYIEDYQDIESVNFAEDRKKEGWEEEKIRTYLARNSRDHARTPMQWNAEKHAGFTAGTPWMAENQNYEEINVENSRKNPDSLFYFYQKLIALRRKNDTLVYGDFRLIEEENPDIFAYERNLGEKKLIVLCNFRDTAAEMKARYDLTKGTVLIHNDTESLTKEVWKLQPYEAYMIELLQ